MQQVISAQSNSQVNGNLAWPLICTVIGVGGFLGVIGWVVSGLWC
ncbi:hypothetical protein QC820_16485 [Halomonas mongoliensis]|uniref:Uncharacterized protein n=1 Tax=Halomonas mongoliensis TaxID=321265 RepID=A0ABU1GSK0_9GAMM|nr:hypothetical protein [Halomonas mongoliensis]MDR5894388.1 hypothetical protein [Halomonas mongoliensis]